MINLTYLVEQHLDNLFISFVTGMLERTHTVFVDEVDLHFVGSEQSAEFRGFIVTYS